MKISMVGTGYVGLVTGACFAYTGNEVCCLDINKKKISSLKKGKVPIFEEKLDNIIRRVSNQGNLSFTANGEKAIDKSEIIDFYIKNISNNIKLFPSTHHSPLLEKLLPFVYTNSPFEERVISREE